MIFSAISTLTGIVSAAAVLASLLLVRRQLQESHVYQQALIQQGRASRSADIAMRLMSPDFAEAYHSCMCGDTDVTPTQLVQFIGYCRAVFLVAEDSYLQHRDGLLDEPGFNSFGRSLRSLFESPGMKAAWAILRERYDSEFATYMDSVVNEARHRPIVIQHALWKATVSNINGPTCEAREAA
ncbi:hypothetical protein [Frigoriglobus tundricola]|uniref:DUF4760 domain-containing protein n=1 Tax=Frigoriglobus tundricola TaxID=2774151 RepID=A0A6M5YM29_9BACT|nr:hypothetical protein [Frigoriglobus tundricola]QJW94386.1 hypothetical protein FTUN_1906 [Frigoriglobus tundricola]